MALVFRPRRGMKSTMAGDKASLVLESGELFLEYPDTGVGTGASRFKIGDGTTEYSDLPYATPFIFTIQKNGSTVNPNANGVVNLTIGTADVSGLQSALDGKLSTTGNAASASKLQTARAITLAGDVSGTANFDGSVGITINTTVKDDSHNHTIANVDGLQSALDGKLSTSGNAASASKWATARNINGLSVDGTANRVNFGTCSTAAGTAAKTVDCAGFDLVTGAEITVKFTVTNTAGSPTLNVNNTGAKSIQYRGAAISAGALAANRVYTFRYDGTNYLLVGDLDSNTTYSLSSFGVTATAAELNTLDGITATTAELNKMHGVTATTAELNYVDGVTSNIQTQLNGKAASNHSHAFSAITGTLDASKLSGTIDIARLPAAALERCVVVADDNARFDLTTANVQLGDTVKVTATNMMYMVVDTAELDNEAGYEAYTASVAWSNITGKPGTYPPSTHTHNYAGSSSAGGAANSAVKLQTARTISLGGDASGSTTFDGSGNVTINVAIKDDSHSHTIANVDGLQTALDGKAASSHTHNYAGSSSAGGAANSANQINSSGLVGANLNDYQTAGKFYYGGGSNKCTNMPSGVDAFGMYVIKTASGYVTQILYDIENHMWIRTYGDSAWTSWVEVYTSANKPTASEIGAAASSHTHNYAGSSSAGGAANSAVKLQTARAITLSGDVTGTANFDGSAGITITATVKDDSHSHTIANVDGLQTALDGKLSTGGTAAAATKLATARNINGLTFDGTANRVNYGSCSTAAGTAAKTVACTGFSLVTGAEITVKFTVTNTAANPTLNVNNTGAKAIYYRGAAISAGYLAANRTYTFRYNGTQYDLVGDIDTNTTYSLSSLGVTATAAELNKLDGATVTVQEINYLDGVTSSIQTQLNGKAASSHTHTTAQVSGLGAAATKAVTDSTSAAAIGTGSNLVTERDIYYGLPKINNAHSYTSNTNIFAPTTGGNSGQVLRSNGSTATPTWTNAADLISTLDCGDEG